MGGCWSWSRKSEANHESEWEALDDQTTALQELDNGTWAISYGRVDIPRFLPDKPLNRAGRPAPVAADVVNLGDADAVEKATLSLPQGVQLLRTNAEQVVPLGSSDGEVRLRTRGRYPFILLESALKTEGWTQSSGANDSRQRRTELRFWW